MFFFVNNHLYMEAAYIDRRAPKWVSNKWVVCGFEKINALTRVKFPISILGTTITFFFVYCLYR